MTARTAAPITRTPSGLSTGPLASQQGLIPCLPSRAKAVPNGGYAVQDCRGPARNRPFVRWSDSSRQRAAGQPASTTAEQAGARRIATAPRFTPPTSSDRALSDSGDEPLTEMGVLRSAAAAAPGGELDGAGGAPFRYARGPIGTPYSAPTARTHRHPDERGCIGSNERPAFAHLSPGASTNE
jgi:hypothetical protein